ncbi:hypothetical protein IQ268_10020 [Oculatella sp. LEGE 06141]|uniref:hypothetical protein n=1 Tax=Oculatella sp. LEGE 06141 TaxID=1828648 RepID=UPI00187EBC47|nr:hypothetical protein [Oculatella sp. LEGE 06141]MBE9178896.1 hypothetical protein [Oculatella sp. LEGE 06141]
MKREVVQDFLNLPGIAGVALMNGRSRPYFCGVDQTLNFQQKEALAQGIQQVVETTPVGFECFEFQFTEHRVYIYKLEHGIILLVLTGKPLVYSSYVQAVERLKTELQEDISNTIATFRLLAGNLTLSDQNYWKGRSESHSVTSGYPGLTATSTPFTATQTVDDPPPPRHSFAPQDQSSFTSAFLQAERSATPSVHADVSLKELLAALNYLSQFTTQYLGTNVVTNYWKSSRPTTVDWLGQFEIDRAAHLNFAPADRSTHPSSLTAEQHRWVQEWIATFIQRCAKVIRDFPLIIERALDDHQRHLLFEQPHHRL